MSSRVLAGMAVIFGVGLMAFALSSGNITGAFFSDSATSTGNTFTVGAGPDLQIDHPYASNCAITLFSGTSDIVQETNKPAVPAWVHSAWATIPGATWIWNTTYVDDPLLDQNFTFVRTFNWNGAVGAATLQLAADNHVDVYLNNIQVYSSHIENNYNPTQTINLVPSNALLNGTNILKIKIENLNFSPSSPGWIPQTPQDNPGGVIYRLDIQKANCNIWTDPRDLDGNAVVYNFDNVKPGDHGEDVYSIHLKYADAWACLLVKNKIDDENVLTSPEVTAGDTTDNPNGGELSKFMNVFGWIDANQNGIYEVGEEKLFQGSLSDIVSAFNISDSQTPSGPLVNGTTKYMGLAWCFGTFTGVDTYNLGCDGSSTANNVAQTDKLTADFVFYVEQFANNPNFKCESFRDPQ